MDNKIKFLKLTLISGNSFCFFYCGFSEKNSFLTPTSKQPNQFDTIEQQTMQLFTKGKRPNKTHFDGCDCVLLFVLCEGGFCVPLDWSTLPNRKAFRKLIDVSRGEKIHNNSSGNDEVPDGVRELLPFCKMTVQ